MDEHRSTILVIIVALAFLAGLLTGMWVSRTADRCHEWSDGSRSCQYGSH